MRVWTVVISCWLAAVPAGAWAAAAAAKELKSALASKPDLDRGAELFKGCVTCHGADGSATADGGIPAIAGQHMRVVAKQLVDYRHARRWDIRMEQRADQHHLKTPQQIADVAAYVSSLPPKPPAASGSGEWVEHGKEVYARQCSSCHGAAGQGDDRKLVPRLAGQHFEYLLRQLYDAVDGRRPNMSTDHVERLKGFVLEDYQGVADYLSRLPPYAVVESGSASEPRP